MANLLGQLAQQMQDLETQLVASRSQIERLRAELATKDSEIARVSMPRLIKLRSEGDVGYFHPDDVKTVRQRLADRDIALRELKDMMRRQPSDVLGKKLRKHEWVMTRVADLPPTSLWEDEELEREAQQGIQDEETEMERSPPPSPGRTLLPGKNLAAVRNVSEYQPKSELPATPGSNHNSGQKQTSEDRKQAPPPRQDIVVGSVEAPPVSSHRPSSNTRNPQTMADRKPVCKCCWDNREWCDSLSVCSNCKAADDKCIYMQCRSGMNCRIMRCVYIHPDQWSDRDQHWRVEEGSLRYQPLDPRQRISRRSPEDDLFDSRNRTSRGSITTKKRARSPAGGPDVIEDGFIRKSVCTRCFDTRILCDFNGRCNPCRDAGMKCVRIHCKQGLACRARKCPCVHPGQWDLRDTTWNVEVGE